MRSWHFYNFRRRQQARIECECRCRCKSFISGNLYDSFDVCDNCRIAAAATVAAERTADELCECIFSAKWIWLRRWGYCVDCVRRAQCFHRCDWPQCNDFGNVDRRRQPWQAIAVDCVCVVHWAFNRCGFYGRISQPSNWHPARSDDNVLLLPEHRHSNDSAIDGGGSNVDKRRSLCAAQEFSQNGNYLRRTRDHRRSSHIKYQLWCSHQCKL